MVPLEPQKKVLVNSEFLKTPCGKTACVDCHEGTTNRAGDTVVSPNLHVNGTVDIQFSESRMSRGTDNRCSGSCHGEQHNSRDWLD